MKVPAAALIALLLLAHGLAATPLDQTTSTAAPRAVLATGESLDIAPDLAVKRLSNSALLVRHKRPWPANSLLVEMADGTLVLAGTPYTPRATKILIAWLERSFGKRRTVAINTHYHLDGMGGNQALLAAKIPVYGSDLSVKALTERGPQMLAQVVDQIQDPELRKEFAALPLAPPDQVFKAKEGLTLELGQESVIVHFPGPAHSEDNVVVYFPAQRILFGGCMVRDGSLGNIAEADLARWPRSIQDLSRFKADIVVPGHGNPGSEDLVTKTEELLLERQKREAN